MIVIREVLREYGSSIITFIAVVAITGILGLLMYNKTGEMINNNDTESFDLLNNQALLPVPELTVKKILKVGEQVRTEDIFDVSNMDKSLISITPREITTKLNDSNSDAVLQSLVNVDGDFLLFARPGVYYLTVDIRQEGRKINRTFKILVVTDNSKLVTGSI